MKSSEKKVPVRGREGCGLEVEFSDAKLSTIANLNNKSVVGMVEQVHKRIWFAILFECSFTYNLVLKLYELYVGQPLSSKIRHFQFFLFFSFSKDPKTLVIWIGHQ